MNRPNRFLVVPDFFSGAEDLRSRFDAHFDTPYRQTPAEHHIWNYWHVPQIYTYLRGNSVAVLGREHVSRFVKRLRAWSVATLGLSHITLPQLSFYVDGCWQGLHNDAKNGRFAFVYSLTRWETRRFVGGETMVFKDVDVRIGSAMSAAPAAATSFYDLVEPRFNQLLLFDDRSVHGVQVVRGGMDPRDSRVVIHGHIMEEADIEHRIFVDGSLTREHALPPLMRIQEAISRKFQPRNGAPDLMSFRISVAPAGHVANIEHLATHASPGESHDAASALEIVLSHLDTVRFRPMLGPSQVTVALLLGADATDAG